MKNIITIQHTQSVHHTNGMIGSWTDWEVTIDDRCLDDAESRRDVWNRMKPFYDEIMDKAEENIIMVSHGDTLSILNAMWLELEPEMLNQCDLFGMAGGVSFLNQGQDKKHRIRKLSDMSYIK